MKPGTAVSRAKVVLQIPPSDVQPRADLFSASGVEFLETSFLTFRLKAEAVAPLSGCQGRRGRAGSSAKAGNWALAPGGVRQVGGKDEAGIKLGRKYEFTLWGQVTPYRGPQVRKEKSPDQILPRVSGSLPGSLFRTKV